MRVLMIGQLPKEIGGNYTTGVANVLYELSKRIRKDIKLSIFGTNISNKHAKLASTYRNQYIGYSFLAIKYFLSSFFSPLELYKEFKYYRDKDHQSPLRYIFYRVNFQSVIKDITPDVIHIHSVGLISTVKFALKKLNIDYIPLVLTCHGIFYRGTNDDLDRLLKDRYLNNIRLVDSYTGLTEESKNEYNSLLDVNPSKVSIIPNGVDCGKFYYDSAARTLLRKQMNICDSTVVFITVASVQERKGQFNFVKVLRELCVDFQYWIIGSGPDINNIENYIIDNKLEDKIKLLGYKNHSEINMYYSAADIYAHVSTMEGQALCEIEAYATGLSTIVNKNIKGTIPDISSGDYYIIDFESIDYSNFIKWIKNRNRNRISRTNFDWEKIFDMYIDLYKKISDIK